MELVIPLIEESLVPPAKEYFEEDGLILWVPPQRYELTIDGAIVCDMLHRCMSLRGRRV